jgi:hypothetical protein
VSHILQLASSEWSGDSGRGNRGLRALNFLNFRSWFIHRQAESLHSGAET